MGSSSISEPAPASALEALLSEIRACRFCASAEATKRLAHEPRPVLRAKTTARIAVCGQAPGTRVHATGVPFNDRSGVRLRDWMGVSEAEFYDEACIAIVPMGFCFPGQNERGADLPPRPECAPRWRQRIFDNLARLDLILLVGRYSQLWHLNERAGSNVTEAVGAWRSRLVADTRPRLVSLPHPSWRNNAWLKSHPWFEHDLVPALRVEVRKLLR